MGALINTIKGDKMNKIDEKVTKITDRIYVVTDRKFPFGIRDRDIIEKIVRLAVERTTTNLCTDCTQEFATCHLPKDCKIIFGEGVGDDNVIACKGFVNKGAHESIASV